MENGERERDMIKKQCAKRKGITSYRRQDGCLQHTNLKRRIETWNSKTIWLKYSNTRSKHVSLQTIRAVHSLQNETSFVHLQKQENMRDIDVQNSLHEITTLSSFSFTIDL
jgi:hypothetical protein